MLADLTPSGIGGTDLIGSAGQLTPGSYFRLVSACADLLTMLDGTHRPRFNDGMKINRQIVVFDAADLNGEPRLGFQVYADPAGHPFCLCWG